MKKLTPVMLAILATSCSSEHSVVNQDTLSQGSQLNKTDVALYGAEVFSHEKVLFGKFIIRMKMISSPGVVSSFFTYDNESWQGGIPWREIDIEAIGKHRDLLQTNLITGSQAKRIHSENTHTVTNLDEFNEFTLIWTPNEISWQVNGVTIHEELSSHSQQVIDMRDSPQSYRMNVWISEAIGWVGPFDINSLPLYQVVDWIEYYPYQDGEFTLAWRDDFDTFDQSRWGKGDWGFDSNLVTFSPSNVAVSDGQLILGITAKEPGIPSIK
ncbi:family 16 glycosylhydrolase [Vibrio sp. ZSDZ34]|jgi:beta-glucanase (GH16 family)|uniref:Family 16 glycosylhydrolase n=1 Tax=Vibrio gelatinilyticus TaxID=2893468 RepID=A0A9X1WFC2_9VIBR|nr:family 16 glycosylhydrolase [Vibrio gelatinilyticus]MCJ2378410.1 family 16 glycosylhydrolase [Vibrio gelatinilyticus]